MAKETVAQVAPSFHDFNVKLRELDQICIQGLRISYELTSMIRARFNSSLTNESITGNF